MALLPRQIAPNLTTAKLRAAPSWSTVGKTLRVRLRCIGPSGSTGMPKRELIEPKPGDKRYVRRDEAGHFTKEQDDVGRSLVQDRRKKAKHTTPQGQGDRGDRKSASK